MNQYRLLLLALFVLTLFLSCGREEPTPQPVIRPVRYQRVFSAGGTRVRTFSGLAHARIESRLSFRVRGTILRVPVRMGDTVRAGQLIAELDPTVYQVQLQEAQAGLVQAQAEARNAEANYERVRALFENENASLNELDTARAGSESTAALVRSVEKRLELAQLQLQYTRLTSPVSGAIADVKMEDNETVSPGQPIVVLNSGSRPEVKVAVPEGLIVQIKKGSSVTVTFDAFAGKEFPAVVTEVGVAAMGSATTFPVVVRLVGSHAEIRPGMAAEVAFHFRYRGEKEQFWVPPHSVGEDREGRFIFIVELTEPGFGIARRRPVKVGELSSEGLEILEGLVDGELLVTAGVSMLEDGRQVKLPRE